MNHPPELLAAIERETRELAQDLSDCCAGRNVAIGYGALIQLLGETLVAMKGHPDLYDGAVKQLTDLPGKVDAWFANKASH